MWKCNKCQKEFPAYPGLVRNTIKPDGIIESAQMCDCGGWRILQSAQPSMQPTPLSLSTAEITGDNSRRG